MVNRCEALNLRSLYICGEWWYGGAHSGTNLMSDVRTTIEALSQKQLSELETQVINLLVTLRKAKLTNQPIALMLKELEQELGDIRRERYDAANSDYAGY